MSGRSQMATMNGKRPSSMAPRHHQNQIQIQNPNQNQNQTQNQNLSQNQNQNQNETSPQHFDLIKYINESWNTVSKELDYHNQHGNTSNYRSNGLVTYYQEQEPNLHLKDFQPFDLEAYWNQRGSQSMARNASS